MSFLCCDFLLFTESIRLTLFWALDCARPPLQTFRLTVRPFLPSFSFQP